MLVRLRLMLMLLGRLKESLALELKKLLLVLLALKRLLVMETEKLLVLVLTLKLLVQNRLRQTRSLHGHSTDSAIIRRRSVWEPRKRVKKSKIRLRSSCRGKGWLWGSLEMSSERRRRRSPRGRVMGGLLRTGGIRWRVCRTRRSSCGR